MQSGFLLINKTKDWTSHDVVGYVRNIARKTSGDKKIRVGHAGTLDPFATGLLIVGVGKDATKRLDEFKALPKTYVATLRLGAISNTYDRTGNITYHLSPITPENQSNIHIPDQTHISDILKSFVGTQSQIPPMYSAKKVGGKKLYELARQGIEIERKPSEITIFDIKLLDYSPITYQLSLIITCSSGTYIRTLAHDIGQKLGCGAYCEELERTQIGLYSVGDAHSPAELSAENLDIHLIT